MPGSGKSSTGINLSKLLKTEFIDLDSEIEKKENCSICDIFIGKGEKYFRDLESTLLEKFSKVKNSVIAAGGGVVLSDKNIEIMKDTGKIIFLKTSLEVLWLRIQNKNTRPLLNTENPKLDLEKIYQKREEMYKRTCDFIIETDEKTPDIVSNEIHKIIEEKS